MGPRTSFDDRPMASSPAWATARTVIVASGDTQLRARLCSALSAMRWRVLEASGGAEALARLESARPEALLVDSWLPDLEVSELCELVDRSFPALEILRMDGVAFSQEIRSPRRHELLVALRGLAERSPGPPPLVELPEPLHAGVMMHGGVEAATIEDRPLMSLPELVGETEVMLELTEMIRLVAPSMATVLIEGETGTGKELVAQAVHRLSTRRDKPYAVLNCAAIPESLLEAELFGHVRGAFTGAVQSRTGRIAAADGGTLFLDEIGEMPLALQAKMLRFLEYGEVQRVGDNEQMHVDVRVVAATHQPLERRAEEGLFRLDLYHRLAVFPIEVPPLRERMSDVPLLAEHFLLHLAQRAPRKRLTDAAMAELIGHGWPGNVRELMHVLERASILAGDRCEIDAPEIRIRRRRR